MDRLSRFFGSVANLSSSGSLSDEDRAIIAQQPDHRILRKEEPIVYEHQKEAIEEWMQHGYKTYSRPSKGIRRMGWKLLEEGQGPTFGVGASARITLSYKRSERGKPLESRHLAVAKVLKLSEFYREIWTETHILKGCVHENIIDIYGVFAVDLRQKPSGVMESVSTWFSTLFQENTEKDIWILLEYANAGDLTKELERYRVPNSEANPFIPEAGALYYMKQICAGVKYLHGKNIFHRDLHPGNIFLKYKSDGTKVCMVADFGMALILSDTSECYGNLLVAGVENTDMAFQWDVMNLVNIARFMMDNWEDISPEATAVIEIGTLPGYQPIETIDTLLARPWFSMPAVPPMPKSMTPLLRSDVVTSMGYLPPRDPAGTTLPQIRERYRSGGQSFSERMRHVVSGIPSRLRSMSGHSSPGSRVTPARPEEEPIASGSAQKSRASATRDPGTRTRERGTRRSSSPEPGSSRVAVSPRRQREESPSSPMRQGLSRSGPAAPERPSLRDRVRRRTRSLGQAIARPFRRH